MLTHRGRQIATVCPLFTTSRPLAFRLLHFKAPGLTEAKGRITLIRDFMKKGSVLLILIFTQRVIQRPCLFVRKNDTDHGSKGINDGNAYKHNEEPAP